MDERQVRRTIRELEKELKGLDDHRRALEDALASLQRLLPPEPGEAVQKEAGAKSDNGAFPGITEGVIQIIGEGNGRPVPVGTIREAFANRGWLFNPEGKDRTQTIYETLRRLHRDQNRIIKLGKEGYVLPASEGQTQKNSFLLALRSQGR